VDKVIAGNMSLPVSYAMIADAEHQYSEARCRDIAAEYRFQYPGLSSVFETFRGMLYAFERDDLEPERCREAPPYPE
jgi:hypothetical protein